MVRRVANYSHYLVIGFAGRFGMRMRWNLQVLAYGIVLSKVLLGKLTAHNHLVRSRATFVAGKKTTAHKWNSKSSKIAGIGPACQSRGQVFACREWRVLFHLK